MIIPEATKKGYAIAKEGDGIYVNRPHQKRGVVQKDMIPTLTTQVDNDLAVVVKGDTPNLKQQMCNQLIQEEKVKEDLQPKLVGGIGEKKSNNGTQYYQQDRIYDSNAVAMCHPAGLPSGSYMYQLSNLRIRKLSPRETFRLMGVKDEDFDKIKNNQSDSSLWHLAGDSIVTWVMYYMFKNLF